MKIYHKDIFMPEYLIKPLLGNRLNLNYSYHAKRACVNDKYGLINPLTTVLLTKINVMEIYLNEYNKTFKVLVRSKQEETLDSCLIINLMESLVVTTWLCKSEDNHLTLNKNNYILA